MSDLPDDRTRRWKDLGHLDFGEGLGEERQEPPEHFGTDVSADHLQDGDDWPSIAERYVDGEVGWADPVLRSTDCESRAHTAAQPRRLPPTRPSSTSTAVTSQLKVFERPGFSAPSAHVSL